MLSVICRGGLYFFQCLPRCLFGYFICFSQLGLLVFSFYLSDSVDYFHNSLFLTDSIFLRFVDFVFCSLLINTTFCSFTWFCTFIVTCNYVITSTLILFKAHFYLKVVITEEGLWPKCFLLNFLIFFYVRSCPSSQFFNFLRSFMLRGLDWESLLILLTLWHLCWPESSGDDFIYIVLK